MKTFFLFLGLAGAAGSMHASAITFITVGTLADGATLSGNVVIDTATGVVQSTNLNVTSPVSLTGLTFDLGPSGQGAADYSLFADVGDLSAFVLLDLPATTLVGYAGGNICLSSCVGFGGSNSRASSPGDSNTLFTSGSLTAAPEPRSLALCLAGGALLAWKRRHWWHRL